MAQLDNSIRGSGLTNATVTTPTSEEDLLSVKSDDSDADSECFVVINQSVDDLARDNALFAINSKRASPVEIAAEAVEDVASTFSSLDLGGQPTKSASIDPPNKEGVVSTTHLTRSTFSQF